MIFSTITGYTESGNEMYTANIKISDIAADPAFKDYGRLIFPVNTGYYSGDTLESLHLTWYNYINNNYSLWGGSAGARMAAWLGSNSTDTM